MHASALAAKWDSPPKDALDTLVLRCHLWYPEIDARIAEHVAANPNISITDKVPFLHLCGFACV